MTSNEELLHAIQRTVGEPKAMEMLKSMFPHCTTFIDLSQYERGKFIATLEAVKAGKKRKPRPDDPDDETPWFW